MKGSHKRTHSASDLACFAQDLECATCIEAQPGDAVIHSARIVHWSPKSESTELQRRAISYFYWAGSTSDTGFQNKTMEKASMEVVSDGFDIIKCESALKELDRDWAKLPGVLQMFRDDPASFLNGLKAKDEEAFNFIKSKLNSL